MLKVGLPVEAVKHKMAKDGETCDASVLDGDPEAQIPLHPGPPNSGGSSELVSSDNHGPKVALGEHPTYAKYFKMLKVGLPKEAVAQKMVKDGVDAKILSQEPTTLVSLSMATGPNKGGHSPVPVNKPKPRRKKLHWSSLDAEAVHQDSIWFDDDEEDDDLLIDEKEFNQLFVEEQKEMISPTSKGSGGSTSGAKSQGTKGFGKKQVPSLIESKRAQNGGIALSKILRSNSCEEVRDKIFAMDGSSFTPEELKSMQDYLPDINEARKLANYKGELSELGVAERYMAIMRECRQAKRRVEIMIFKSTFAQRIADTLASVRLVERACDDVKMSLGLKKVLKAILKVGNQMNDGRSLGFRMEVLSNLSSAKAFDKKTTILEYVVMVMSRNDPAGTSLKIEETLQSISAANRIQLSTIEEEVQALTEGLKASNSTLLVMRNSLGAAEEMESSHGKDDGVQSSMSFMENAKAKIASLQELLGTLKSKYDGVIKYFGEDENLPSHQLFSTLTGFIREFTKTRDAYQQKKEREEKKKQKEMKQEAGIDADLTKKPPNRRASVATVPLHASIAAAAAAAANQRAQRQVDEQIQMQAPAQQSNGIKESETNTLPLSERKDDQFVEPKPNIAAAAAALATKLANRRSTML